MSNDRGLEDPVPDVVEQEQDVLSEDEADEGGQAGDTPLEADEADAAEQAREFEVDQDDYR
ncbi:MAG TPA: hypothetical protein VGI64_02100 [Streptosporangiaceae bacterium]|jgi:hypothetical protein